VRRVLGEQPPQLLLRVRRESQRELACGFDDRTAHPSAVFRQPGEQLLAGEAFSFRPALGRDELPCATGFLRQRAQLRCGERLLDQVAFLDRQLLSREKLPRLDAPRSARFAKEADHAGECTSAAPRQ
jgi:hypothetical protein